MEDKNLPIYTVQKAIVVDDMSGARDLLTKMLRTFGFENVVVASSGEEVLKNCKLDDRYDIIFCDYNLGAGINGQQLLDEMSEEGYITEQTIFMLVTADASREVVLSALEYRPDYYITKPFNTATIKNRLDRALEEKQFLADVYMNINAGNLDEAIEVFENKTKGLTKQTVKHQRFYTDMLFKGERYKEALNIYNGILEDKSYDWARLGRARCLHALGQMNESIKQLEELVETISMEMEVYDELAQQLISKNHLQSAQTVLEKGLSLSPNSFDRQKYYAAICQDLKDHEKSIRAQTFAMKTSKNTRNDKAENYVELAATQIKYSETLTRGAAADMLRAAGKNLTLVDKEIQKSPWPSASAKLVQAIIAEKGQEKKQRDQLIESALEVLLAQQECSGDNSQIMFDCIELLQQLDREEDALKLLSSFSDFFPDRQDITSRIDRMSPSPVSEIGRKRMEEVNRIGVRLFKKNKLEEATDHYRQAASDFPNHVTLQLNYIAVVIKYMEVHGITSGDMEECEAKFKQIQREKCNKNQLDKYNKLMDSYLRLDASKPQRKDT